MAAGSSLAVLERTERLSPELVLVDPALAERARSQLADPDDTVARLEALARESAVTAAARRLAELDSLATQERRTFPLRTLARPRLRTRSRHPVLIGAFATVTLTTALLLGMGADPGGPPNVVQTAAVGEPPASTAPAPTAPAPTAPAPTAPAPTAPAPAKPAPATPAPTKPAAKPSRPQARTPAVSRPVVRPFAWAPSAGASAYHVELFRGAERVFAAETKRAAIDIPARWRFAGRRQMLEPGEYRWYVWPVIAGKRSGTATVQATLSID
jgi:hypothetical protein